jgi:NAD(P)-dependent dehydrogenase (short-subunit alcohol dehydrogenase family)
VSKQPICLIVGAGDYIGAAIAKRFAAGGFTVCLARRGGEKNAGLVAEIEAAGGKAHSYSLDAREEEQVIACIDSIESERGALDIVIFNVGGNVNFPLLETTERVFRKVWMMACLGGFLTGREAAKHMLPRGHGSIFLPVPQRVFAEEQAILPLHRRSLACAHSRRAWRVS